MKISVKILLIFFLISNYLSAQTDTSIYYPDGSIHLKGQILKDRKIGVWQELREDGSIGKEYKYIDSNKVILKIFNTYTSKISELITYTFDHADSLVKNGNYTSYDINDNILIDGYFKNNEKTGEWKEYFQYPEIKSIKNYKHGLLNGTYEEYYNNGQVRAIGEYKDNIRRAIWYEYYLIGNLKSRGEYFTDALLIKYDGREKVVFKNKSGAVLRLVDYTIELLDSLEMKYKNEISFKSNGAFSINDYFKHGKWEYWNEEGNLIREEIYYRGDLVDTNEP